MKRPLSESADFSIDRTDASSRAARKADNAPGPGRAKNVLDWVIERKAREDRAWSCACRLTSVPNYKGVTGAERINRAAIDAKCFRDYLH